MSNPTATPAPVKAARKPRTVKPKAAPVVALTLSIGDTAYNVQVIDAGEFGSRAVRLTNRTNGNIYDCLVAPHGLECDCPDFVTRHADHGTCCKHLDALRQVGLIEAPDASRYPTPEDFAPASPDLPQSERDRIADKYLAPAPCCDPAESSPCSNCSAGFADELHSAIGLPPITSPADDEEPIGWGPLPKRSYLLTPRAAERPHKPLLPPPGRYGLADLADAQASFYAGWDSAVGELFAQTMRDLAASIRATGATSTAEYQDRIAQMEAARDAELQARGFDQGFASAMADCSR